MTSIAFWETLSPKALRSRLYTFPGWLSLSKDSFERHTSALLCCLFLVSVFVCFFSFSRPRGKRHIHTRDALQALFTVILPTCSLWPARYVKSARVPRSRVVIPLEMIIEDTVDGVIEFRNPINDLANLVGSGVVVKGYTICVSIGWKWWINCFEWCLLSESNPGHIFGLTHWLPRDMSTADSISLRLSLFPFALTSSTTLPLLCLDGAPRGTIPSLNAGCKVILEFTAFSPSLRTLSTAQIVSALPFVISKRSRRRPRSLVSVLEQLNAAYGPNLVVDSLSNVSADYEQALRHVYESFSGEPSFREMWVKNVGVRAWRLDMFLVALEAALVRRGWIERWAVQVIVK